MTKKFFLLALSIYIFLYFFPYPLTYLPNMHETLDWMAQPIDWFTRWFGKTFFRLHGLYRSQISGGSDSVFMYVKLIALPVLSLIIAIPVFAFTYRKTNHLQWYKWCITYTRYSVGTFMLATGSILLYSSNYNITLDRLEQSLGSITSTDLFLSFMGYSKAYLVFCGLCQIIFGFLLFFKRTTAFGAILCLFFLLNVTVIGLAFNVPTKLISIHIILFLLLILAPNIKSIFNYFVLDRTSRLTSYEISLPRESLYKVKRIAKYCFIFFIVISQLVYISNSTKAEPLRGTYRRIDFVLNGDTIAQRTENNTRWDLLIIENDYVIIDMYKYFQKLKVDTLKHTFKLVDWNDTTKQNLFKYEESNDGVYFFLNISGTYENDTIQARFRKKRFEEYTLIETEFNWVN